MCTTGKQPAVVTSFKPLFPHLSGRTKAWEEQAFIFVSLYSLLQVKGLPLWSSGQFLAADPEVPSSIPGAAKFSE
jgi:hypothetical protein